MFKYYKTPFKLTSLIKTEKSSPDSWTIKQRDRIQEKNTGSGVRAFPGQGAYLHAIGLFVQ